MKDLDNILEIIKDTGTDNELKDAVFDILKFQEEKYLNRFFELSIDMICIAGNDGYFKKVSKSFSRTLGYTEEELLSQPIINFIESSDVAKTNQELNNIREGNITFHFENKYLCKDGSIRWIAWRSVPVPEEELIYAIARDVTEQKEKEFLLQFYTEQLELYKKENLESLRYAFKLQGALLQLKSEFCDLIPASFILFLPKNIVSGDFYWFSRSDEKTFFAVGDCTGHGIPGAMITMLGLNILHAGFNFHQFRTTPELVSFIDNDLNRKLSHKSTGRVMQDGMDVVVCEIDHREMILSVSGANGCLCIVRNDEIIKIRTDKYHIGNAESNKVFNCHKIPVMKGDLIYLFSDGFIDQFGGPLGKKFGSKNFLELLLTLSKLDVFEQENYLLNTLCKWQGEEEQTDDITILGIRI
jgi:PAS domain S-box-containing protein